MKDILSKNEREFVLSSIASNLRVDGRGMEDMRDIKINFGKSSGSVEVQLGRTRVFTSVSCQVVEPRPERPNEGFFVFNTEISPMASLNALDNAGRIGNAAEGELARLIERGLKESRAVDTEALCIVAGAKVWSIKSNIHVIDDCGNLLDCAAISVITALLHFRKPDVTLVGNEATIHPIDEREPVPLSIHHTPISITFGFFPDNKMIIDPDFKEEMVVDGKLTFLVNAHKEICGVSKSGGMNTTMEQVINCSKKAVERAAHITNLIRTALHENIKLKNDSQRRRTSPLELVEYTTPKEGEKNNTNNTKPKVTDINNSDKMDMEPIVNQGNKNNNNNNSNNNNNNNNNIIKNEKATNTKTMNSNNNGIKFDGSKNTWEEEEEKMDIDVKKNNNTNTNEKVKQSSPTLQSIKNVTNNNNSNPTKNTKNTKMIDSDSDSEEEETITLNNNNNNSTTSNNISSSKTATTTNIKELEKQEDGDLVDLTSALKKKPVSKPAPLNAKKKAAANKK